ncbi:hypothetical protein M3Y96_00001700 [Aphelenchoides besseyi]|nr:hypothetical protein M3Y96_00001700 [Aphelenchoides besseyi]
MTEFLSKLSVFKQTSEKIGPTAIIDVKSTVNDENNWLLESWTVPRIDGFAPIRKYETEGLCPVANFGWKGASDNRINCKSFFMNHFKDAHKETTSFICRYCSETVRLTTGETRRWLAITEHIKKHSPTHFCIDCKTMSSETGSNQNSECDQPTCNEKKTLWFCGTIFLHLKTNQRGMCVRSGEISEACERILMYFFLK